MINRLKKTNNFLTQLVEGKNLSKELNTHIKLLIMGNEIAIRESEQLRGNLESLFDNHKLPQETRDLIYQTIKKLI